MKWTEYPIWRIGWLERAFFVVVRALGQFKQPRLKAFTDIIGFDFSKWQGAIDFAKVKAYGARFLILRVGYGVTRDERFYEYIPSALQYFPRLSVYHYYHPDRDPLLQAQKIIEWLGPYKPHIVRVWLDMEFYWSGNYQAPAHWKKYKDALKAAGYKVGWYSRATWWDSRVGTYAAEFAQEPGWMAQYSSALTLLMKGFTRAMIWQKGTPAIGAEVGTESKEVDLNLWNDEYDFAAEWGESLPPPDTGGTMYKRATGSITMRTGPSAVYANAKLDGVSQYVLTGDVLEVGAIQSGFAEILKLYRNNLLTPIPPAPVWCGTAYLVDTTYIPPAPPVENTTSNITVTWTDSVVSGVSVDGTVWKKQ